MSRIIPLARSRHGNAKNQERDAETWTRELAAFPDRVRYNAANLAAHSWDVTIVDDRVLISCCWYDPGQQGYHDLEGNQTDLTEEEMDILYPRAVEADQRWPRASIQSGVWRYHTIALEADEGDA